MALIKGKQIATGADGIATANIVDDAVTQDKIGPQAVGTTELEDLAVTTGKIGNNQVTAAKVGSDVIVAAGTNPFTGNQAMGGFRITGLGAPSADDDAATKQYVDNVAAGLSWKDAVRVRAQGNVTISGPGATIDGETMQVDDRVLLDQQSTGSEDGIYLWKGAAVAMVRSADAQAGDDFSGVAVFVEEGTDQDTGWVCTDDSGSATVGTDDLAFTQFTGAAAIVAGTGLTKTGNTINAIGGNGITANADDLEVDYETVGNITSVDAGDSAAAGTNNTAARGDHQHAVNTGAAGDAAVGDTAGEGTSTDLARADHQHGVPKGSPLSVGTANSDGTSGDFADAEHIHAAPKPTTSNKDMACSTTTSDGDQATATAVASTPGLDGYVAVRVNGIGYKVGDGVKTGCDCYFSGDSGATARAISAIVSTDTCHWNGSVAGFQLATSDRMDFMYEAF